MMAEETWFDRLSARRTRRQTLRSAATGAAAAAAAAALPFVAQVPKARAAGPKDCKKGCLYAANRGYSHDVNVCVYSYAAEGIIYGPIFFRVPIANIVYNGRSRRCVDRARAAWLPDFLPCFDDYCPGFDPKAGPYAPCQCAPEDSCNPCEALETGYICCIYPQGSCNGDCCTAGPGC
jgi:hypothetical protein